MKHTKLKAFTLVEMLLVVAIIGIIAAGAIITSQGFRNQVVFVSNYQSIEGLFSEARSRSLTGESYSDTNDYDGDGITTDLILPYGYIVNFAEIDDVITVSLHADVYTSDGIGELDTNDVKLKSIKLDDSVRLSTVTKRNTGGTLTIDDTDFSILYKTPDADFEVFSTDVGGDVSSLQVKLFQVDNDDEEVRAKYLFMHFLFGIPEVLNETYLVP